MGTLLVERSLPSLISIPLEMQETILACIVEARELSMVSFVSPLFKSLSEKDEFWEPTFSHHFPGLHNILECNPPEWWTKASWKYRFAALCSGAQFPAQVFNRESRNKAEDFSYSCYDAQLCLDQTFGKIPTVSPTFIARYAPMGSMPPVTERGITTQRLRGIPVDVSSKNQSLWDVQSTLDCLEEGQEIEVYWKGRACHPYGCWWGSLGAIDYSADGTSVTITLLFKHYPSSSPWRSVQATFRLEREVEKSTTSAVINEDHRFGYIGGLRGLKEGEVVEWRRGMALVQPTGSSGYNASFSAVHETELFAPTTPAQWPEPDEPSSRDLDPETNT